MTTATDDDKYAREQEELGRRFDWSYLPQINDEDGWQPMEFFGGTAAELTNQCRIDHRFRHNGSYTVRRLGGEALAERLVAAVEACPHISPAPGQDDEWVPRCDVMLVDGILFEFINAPDYGPTVEIINAEVVAPSKAIPTPLLEFFADIWERRAKHAQAVAADLIAELKRRGDRPAPLAPSHQTTDESSARPQA